MWLSPVEINELDIELPNGEVKTEKKDQATLIAELISRVTSLEETMEYVLEHLPKEKRYGQWCLTRDKLFKCSCCGVEYTASDFLWMRNDDTDPYAPKYCPKCGAEMGEETLVL